uniref:hypothetical protein n=1 Tax=Vibrio cholerae TaxID=666 RepID=UPI00301BE610
RMRQQTFLDADRELGFVHGGALKAEDSRELHDKGLRVSKPDGEPTFPRESEGIAEGCLDGAMGASQAERRLATPSAEPPGRAT